MGVSESDFTARGLRSAEGLRRDLHQAGSWWRSDLLQLGAHKSSLPLGGTGVPQTDMGPAGGAGVPQTDVGPAGGAGVPQMDMGPAGVLEV